MPEVLKEPIGTLNKERVDMTNDADFTSMNILLHLENSLLINSGVTDSMSASVTCNMTVTKTTGTGESPQEPGGSDTTRSAKATGPVPRWAQILRYVVTQVCITHCDCRLMACTQQCPPPEQLTSRRSGEMSSQRSTIYDGHDRIAQSDEPSLSLRLSPPCVNS